MNRFSNSNEKILIRSKFDALPPFENYLSFTNFSRSFEFSIFNENGNEISIKTNRSIELIIPRDPNLTISIHFQIEPFNLRFLNYQS
jgi:hypothetical protein